jgi:CBS domain containing-hemolysin-like protein
MIPTWTLFALVPPLLLVEGFFSGSEIALLSADRLRLKAAARRGSRGASLALDLARHPERVLSATLLMTNLCVIGLSALLALYFLGRGTAHADLVAVAITSPLVVLLGELVPKTIYQRHADRLAPWVSYAVWGVYWAFIPVTRLLSSYTARLSRLLSPIEEIVSGRRRSKREELMSMLTYGRRETEIKSSERRMLKRIFDFRDTEAKHALIPLVRVQAIEESATIQDALERFQQHRHSRMPVFRGRIDNIVGVLEISDLFTVSDLSQPIRSYITPANYVAETQSLEDLLRDMQREDNEMVVVVDEYGGAVGILTFEDIVEEIVGEIHDEYDTEQPAYKELNERSWLVQARMELTQLNERFGLDLPEGDYETLGGFLLQQFGRIPEPGAELYFDTASGSLKFVIRKANERQIDSVLIERMARHDDEQR